MAPTRSIAARTSGCLWRFAAVDHLGSVREVTQGSVVVERMGYGPWGRRDVVSGPGAFGRGYGFHDRGALSDAWLSQYRAFDSELGRWLSEDPLGESEGPNVFAYVDNNPINFGDPLGVPRHKLVTWRPACA